MAKAIRRLVVASNNPGKLREIAALLGPTGMELIPQSALGIAEAEEPHDTFLENALAKARHAAAAAGLPALADDSGLCVDALDGAPSAVPCISTKRPAPVMTTFMSVSHAESSA